MSEPIDPYDAPFERPRPGHPAVARLHARVEPWLAWFGVRRVVATALTVVTLVVVGWWLLRAPALPTEAGLPFAASSSPSGPTAVPDPTARPSPPPTTSGVVVVHVAGAVVASGVYELPPAARTADAVAAAGGATPEADLHALNLAAPLGDGERVYVPVVGEVVPPPAAVPGDVAGVGPVDLNRATAADLDALPGVGPATAQAIVAHRESNGPFASVEDLEQVRGIGPAKLDAIRPLVTV